jgi:subtilase family serine protease
MVLLLKGDANQEAALAQLIAAQNDPKSPLYHHYLTPQEFGAQFGVADSDVAKMANWLQGHGFKVDELPAGKRAIVFSGTAGQTAAAFNTEIRHYSVAGANHYANTTDPKIPAALASAVGGVVKLHDFRHSANISKMTAVTGAGVANPLYTYGSSHYLSPADYGTIYNINPLYSAGINGTGQTIAVIARSNISISDVASFRSTFGLKANNPQIVIANTNPGVVQGDNEETTLDTEWSGAIAPNATIKVIVAASTNSADGIDLSALYAVNNKVAPIVSLSYGSCEAYMGSTELAFYNSLWQQAAAQGMSVMVSSGDSGAAGCSGGSSSSGTMQAVNGLCSSPYATCVGGTQFVEGSNPGQYWLPGNNPIYGSAISYLPETVWNESASNGGSGLWGGGGGASIAYPKPTWQTGPGVPVDGKRDVPDVSLTASGHDGYLITINGGLGSVGGTSASAPSFAGLMALVNQKMNASQGLANTVLYPLAAKQAAGGAAVFHDIATGNNTVPGVKGFSATAGYDLATGLGSVDANQLVNHWADGTTVAALSLSASSSALTLPVGQSAQTTITSTAVASLKSAVALTVTGAPTGVTATLTPATIASPGSGSTILKVTAATTVPAGTYALTVTGTGGGQTAKLSVTVSVVVPTFALTTGAVSATVLPGNATQFAVTATPSNGFNSNLSLAVTGLPTGVTAAFAPASIGTTGGASNLTLTVAKTAKIGSYALTITATGGGVTKTAAFALTVKSTPSCTLSINPTSISLVIGQAGGVQIACSSPQGTFTGPLALSVTGSVSGATTQLATTTLTPGSTSALTLITSATTVAGQYSLSLTASGSGFSQTISVPVTIAKPSTFAMTPAQSAVTLKAGVATPVTLTSTAVGTFSAAVNFTIFGLPAGVTGTLSKPSVPAPGNGSIVATFTASATAAQGVFPVAVVGASGSITQSVIVMLTIGTAKPDFSFAVNVNTLTIQQGVPSSPVIVSVGNFSGGFNSTITLMFTGLPPGMSYYNTNATTGNNLINITFAMTASTATPAGTYPVTVSASGAGIVHTAIVQMTVTKAGQTVK